MAEDALKPLEQALDAINRLSAVEARQRLRQGQGAGLTEALRRGLGRAARETRARGGPRSGSQGLLYGLLAGYYTFILFLKIWERSVDKAGPA
jgi:hypothetical protein